MEGLVHKFARIKDWLTWGFLLVMVGQKRYKLKIVKY